MLLASLKNIDFSVVGSTNLMPLDVNQAILHEKLALLIFSQLISNPDNAPNLYYSEFHHPRTIQLPEIHDETNLFFTVNKDAINYGVSFGNPRCLSFEEVAEEYPKLFLYDRAPKCIPIKPGADFKEISLYDATRSITDCSEKQRLEELFAFFHTGDDAYSPFKIHMTFVPQQFPNIAPTTPNADADEFKLFQRTLADWYRTGFPRSYTRYVLKRRELPSAHEPHPIFDLLLEETESSEFPLPIFYKPLGPMSYDLRAFRSLPQMRMQRLFLNPNACGLREALIPTWYIHENGQKYAVMTGLPNQETLPLWNVNRILDSTTDTVVVCGCIQDAEALQRANADVNNVAFTGFVGNKLEQVDFSPLSEKDVVFLVSNHNGGSLENAYDEVEKLHAYIKNQIKVRDYAFVQRLVKYPDSTSTIPTPEALADTYSRNRPEVVLESEIPPMDEAEFAVMLAKMRREQAALPFWAKSEIPPTPSSRVDDFLVRGVLYKGVTTLLAGKSGAKKTHFALTLGRYVVAGDKPFLYDRFWTRARPEGYPKKVVYWCFDDISARELKKMNFIYKKNLSQEFADNFFIDSVPPSLMKPELKNIQKELMKYTFKGKLGLPVELLIIDTLSDLKGQEHGVDALKLLADFKKLVMPDLAILVLHHITDVGNIRGGSGIRRGPRITLRMEMKNDVFTMAYEDSTNISLAPEEKNRFSFIFDGLEVKEHAPAHSRKEWARILADYYKNSDYMEYTNDEVGILLGYSGRSVQKKKTRKGNKKAVEPQGNAETVTSDVDNVQNETNSTPESNPEEQSQNVTEPKASAEESPVPN